MEKKLVSVTASFEIMKVKLERDAATAKEELGTLHTKYEMGEARVKALVLKHRMKLNQKIEEALALGWKEWLAQAPKL